jgi:hypothetical protein
MGEARPAYETPESLEREAGVVRRLEERWDASAIKPPTSYRLDYIFCREEAVVESLDGRRVIRSQAKAFCEIKVRRYTWEEIDRMGGYMISLAKWTAAEAFCSISGLPFILAVSAAGEIRFASIRTFEHEGVVHGGRSDRADWQDKEPMVLLSVARFRPL